MIMLDTDILIDIFRGYQPSLNWFETCDSADIAISSFVYMELIQGCRNKNEQKSIENFMSEYSIIWSTENILQEAFKMFSDFHLSHNIGIIDSIIGQTAVENNFKLATYNDKHYNVFLDLEVIHPYNREYNK